MFDEKLRAPLAWGDARSADAALTAARPGWRGTDAGAALSAARDLLAVSPAGRRRAAVVLGDGTTSSLRGAAPAPADGAAVLGLQFPSLPNASVSVAGPAAGSSARAPRLDVRYAAHGASAASPLDLWVGERRAGSASASASAGGEGRAALALPPPDDPTAPAWAGRVAARADALTADDEAFFSVSHRPAPRVLVLHSDPSFYRAGRAGWFLRELFGGARETLAGREADFLEAARWSEADLSRYGAIVLPDATRPSPALGAALGAFAARGGGVWLIPGARAAPAELAALTWLPARVGAPLEPGSPRGVRAAREGEATAGWDELELQRVTISRRFILEPAPGSETWASDADGSPLLVAGSVGRGRAVVWGAPLDAAWSNLGLKPLFVPWARGCLALTIPEGAADAARRAKVGEPLARSWAPGEPAPDRVVVAGPDGRRTTLTVAGRRAVLTEASAPGLYAFEEPGGRRVAYAVDLDRSRGESDLSQLAAPPWRPAKPESLTETFLDSVYGEDLSGLFLALAALMLLVELMLALPSSAARKSASAKGAGEVVTRALALLLLVAPGAMAQQGDRFIWTQVKHGEDWDPYPDAPAAVSSWLAEVTSVRAAPERRAIALKDPALFSSPFLYLAGAAAPPELRDDELRRLRQFVSGGGFLWIEDSSGGPPAAFDRWVRRELPRVLPDAELKPLPADHVLYRTFFLLRGPAGRARVHGAAEGVEWAGRVAVLYTRDDALGAWAKDALGKPLKACVPGGEAQRELAKRMTLNVVMYSLTGSYKSDAVHQAAILDKLRGAP